MKDKKIVFNTNPFLFIGYSFFSLLFLTYFICSLIYILIPSECDIAAIIVTLLPLLMSLVTIYIVIKFTLRFVIINYETILYKERNKVIFSHKTAEITKIKVQDFYREGKFILIYWEGDYIKLSYSLRRAKILENLLHIKVEV